VVRGGGGPLAGASGTGSGSGSGSGSGTSTGTGSGSGSGGAATPPLAPAPAPAPGVELHATVRATPGDVAVRLGGRAVTVGATWHFTFRGGAVVVTARLSTQRGHAVLGTAELAAVCAAVEARPSRVALSMDRKQIAARIADVAAGAWRAVASVAVVHPTRGVLVWRGGGFEAAGGAADGTLSPLEAVCPGSARRVVQTVYDYSTRGAFEVVTPAHLLATVADAGTRDLLARIFAAAGSLVTAGLHHEAAKS
jgi:hypothetical protein